MGRILRMHKVFTALYAEIAMGIPRMIAVKFVDLQR
jgi:hypothetical protein